MLIYIYGMLCDIIIKLIALMPKKKNTIKNKNKYSTQNENNKLRPFIIKLNSILKL